MAYVDIVGEVEPGTGSKRSTPLEVAGNHPLDIGGGWAHAKLELSEVGLEKQNLMFISGLLGITVS